MSLEGHVDHHRAAATPGNRELVHARPRRYSTPTRNGWSPWHQRAAVQPRPAAHPVDGALEVRAARGELLARGVDVVASAAYAAGDEAALAQRRHRGLEQLLLALRGSGGAQPAHDLARLGADRRL